MRIWVRRATRLTFQVSGTQCLNIVCMCVCAHVCTLSHLYNLKFEKVYTREHRKRGKKEGRKGGREEENREQKNPKGSYKYSIKQHISSHLQSKGFLPKENKVNLNMIRKMNLLLLFLLFLEDWLICQGKPAGI